MCAKIIDVSEENIDKYGLFCRKSYMKEECNKNKVKWLKERFKEGLKHKILYVKEKNRETSRGFIEYIPGEYNWRGIHAPNWMVIHCLWVTGIAKNKGYGSKLVTDAIKDAEEAGMNGVVAMTADKQGWIPNPKIFKKLGFDKVDVLEPYFSLYAKKSEVVKGVSLPKFNPISSNKLKEYGDGITVLYSYQCPYVCNMLRDIETFAEENNIHLNAVLMKGCKEAQYNEIHPYGVYSVIYNGDFISYKPGMRKETLERLQAHSKK